MQAFMTLKLKGVICHLVYPLFMATQTGDVVVPKVGTYDGKFM